MKLKFCGAAREVTGSAHLLTLDDESQILLDCGLYQGYGKEMEDFNREWLFDPSKLGCLIVSHAHIDHTGRIPMLIAAGFDGLIYSTAATSSLCSLMLLDSAGIQERETEYFNKKKLQPGEPPREPLYTEEDAVKAVGMFVSVPYDKWFPIKDGVDVLFRDSGHILGSASVTLRIRRADGSTMMFGFTGDIGRPNRPILSDPKPMPEVDYLICESTYGDREHESAPDETDHFVRILHETCVVRGGRVIIPAFSVGRTQEIVYMMDRLVTAGKLPKIKVYVDSPLAVNATQVFIEHPECYDAELGAYLRKDPNPFGFNTLIYLKTVEESKALNDNDEPCVIISSSGMANAGRVKHHIRNNVEDPRATILIVGYASANTPAAILRDGATEIKLFGDTLRVRARVEVMSSFSAHGDRVEMLDLIRNQSGHVKRLFLVHGEIDKQTSWKQYLIEKGGFDQIEIPVLGQEFEL